MNSFEQLQKPAPPTETVPALNRPDDITKNEGNNLDPEKFELPVDALPVVEQFKLKEQALYDAIEALGNEPLVAEIVPPDAMAGETYSSDTMQVLREAVFSVEILRSANQQNRPVAELLQKAVENGRLPRMLQANRALGEYLKLDTPIATAIHAMADAAEAYSKLVTAK